MTANPGQTVRQYARLGRQAAAHSAAALIPAVTLVALTASNAVEDGIAIAATAVLTMLLVVTGPGMPRPQPEGTSAWRLLYSLTARESLIPLGMVAGLIASGLISPSETVENTVRRYPIIWLILTFAALSYAMERSGFFRWAAIRTLKICQGSVPRLTIGFFILSSLFTYLASNDIVILVMTPLVLELSRQSGIRDVRLILLVGCYIAANTLSMGMILGSPSNVIVALATGMGFMEYIALMAFPTIVTAGGSLLTVAFVHAFAIVYVGRMPQYDPQELPHVSFSRKMGIQCALFGAAIAGYSAAITLGQPFWIISLPFSALALVSIRATRHHGDVTTHRADAVDSICSLPWSIVGFATSYFAVAQALLAKLPHTPLDWLQDLNPVWQLLAILGSTALMVNSINDLPAAAITGELVANVQLSGWHKRMAIQALLISLNIGCYLTPAGALAGIMWFHMLRRDGSRYGMTVPKPTDLLWYGGLNFIVASTLLCALLPGAHIAWAIITTGNTPPGVGSTSAIVAVATAAATLAIAAMALTVSLWIMFRRNQPEEKITQEPTPTRAPGQTPRHPPSTP